MESAEKLSGAKGGLCSPQSDTEGSQDRQDVIPHFIPKQRTDPTPLVHAHPRSWDTRKHSFYRAFVPIAFMETTDRYPTGPEQRCTTHPLPERFAPPLALPNAAEHQRPNT